MTLILLPSRAPEPNPVKNVWQYLRQNWLSNRVFEGYDAGVDAAGEAWQKLLAQPDTIKSSRTARSRDPAEAAAAPRFGQAAPTPGRPPACDEHRAEILRSLGRRSRIRPAS